MRLRRVGASKHGQPALAHGEIQNGDQAPHPDKSVRAGGRNTPGQAHRPPAQPSEATRTLSLVAEPVVRIPDAKVALSTASVYPESTATAFEIAARLGYDGVEVMVWTDPVSQDIEA